MREHDAGLEVVQERDRLDVLLQPARDLTAEAVQVAAAKVRRRLLEQDKDLGEPLPRLGKHGSVGRRPAHPEPPPARHQTNDGVAGKDTPTPFDFIPSPSPSVTGAA